MKSIPDVESTPREVPWSDIVDYDDFDGFDRRMCAASVIFGNVFGVNEGSMAWCPDVEPPSEQERLAWIWLCNPDLDAEILPRAEESLRELMLAYRAGEMERWWDSIAPDAG